MWIIDYLNANQGAAIVVLTAVLVSITGYYAFQTRRAVSRADEGNELARAHLELDRRIRRGANVIVRLDRGTRFFVSARGPSAAVDLQLALVVDEWRGPPVVLNRVDAVDQEVHYQVTAEHCRHLQAFDGRTGFLEGQCMNEHAENEAVCSPPFVISAPPGASILTYRRQEA